MINILSCTNSTPDNYFLKLMELIIAFVIGLISSFVIDYIRKYFRKIKNRKFILTYLEKCILSEIPLIRSLYERLDARIKNYSYEELELSAFETFNSKVLNALSPTDYYEIFKKDYILLNEIISIIEFLELELPHKIVDDYYGFINNHLKIKNIIGDEEHIKTCQACLDKRRDIIKILSFRINELAVLKEKIEEISKNYG